jgi:hypothetical protein
MTPLLTLLCLALALIIYAALTNRKPWPLALLMLCAGCATNGNQETAYPAALQAQCEQAYGQGRAMYAQRYGEPSKCLAWQVDAVRGQQWGNQWAIHPTGVMVGGQTSGNRTKIGVGPNMEVNQGDLAHEAYEAWCQIHGKAAH